jgi:hypothetical protein
MSIHVLRTFLLGDMQWSVINRSHKDFIIDVNQIKWNKSCYSHLNMPLTRERAEDFNIEMFIEIL